MLSPRSRKSSGSREIKIGSFDVHLRKRNPLSLRTTISEFCDDRLLRVNLHLIVDHLREYHA